MNAIITICCGTDRIGGVLVVIQAEVENIGRPLLLLWVRHLLLVRFLSSGKKCVRRNVSG